MKSILSNIDKSLQTILAPQITEKATMIADKNNQVAFLSLIHI